MRLSLSVYLMGVGDLKSVIAQKIGLKPETHKLLFRGKEKDDDDHLQTAGVKDSSKVLLMEDITSVQKIPEKVDTSVTSQEVAAISEVRAEADKLADVQKSPEKVETSAISRGGAAVAAVRVEVDKLADQVDIFLIITPFVFWMCIYLFGYLDGK